MKVYILPEVHAEIMYYVNNSDVEISGLGRITRNSNGDMVVSKCYLLEQENTGASTDIDAGAVSTLLYESREDEGLLNFWWHSHVNMNVFWSGTDMATIHEFGEKGFLLATVFNKKGEHRTAYYQGATDFYPPVFVDSIQTVFDYLPSAEQVEGWAKAIKDKCKKKVFAKFNAKGLMDTSALSSNWRWNEDAFVFEHSNMTAIEVRNAMEEIINFNKDTEAKLSWPEVLVVRDLYCMAHGKELGFRKGAIKELEIFLHSLLNDATIYLELSDRLETMVLDSSGNSFSKVKGAANKTDGNKKRNKNNSKKGAKNV